MGNNEHMDRQKLATRVLATRTALGLTQEALAARAGIAVRTLRSIEAGREASHTGATYAKLDRALDWNPGTASDILSGMEGAPGDPSDPLRMISESEVQPWRAIELVNYVLRRRANLDAELRTELAALLADDRG